MATNEMPGADWRAALVIGLSAVSACASEGPPLPPAMEAGTMTRIESLKEVALADAMKRTGLDRRLLKVRSAETVTWSDGSLGCPQPGMLYTQALVPGYRVWIDAGGKLLDYHAGRSGPPMFCPADRAIPPATDNGRT